MTSYEDNWQRYNQLQHEAEQAGNRYEMARTTHAAAEVGSIERAQLEGVMRERQGEMQRAEEAFTAFKQEVQQTQPEQMKHLEMGIAPEAVRMADAAEVGARVAPVIIEELASPDFLNGSGISVLETAKQSIEALKNAPDYIAGAVRTTVAEYEAERNAAIDAQIAKAPPQTMQQERDNAGLDAIQKADDLAFKQKELEKLELKHAAEKARQETQLEKFMASQADKSPEIQAKQAELAEKARRELAEKQEREMRERQAELERSQREAQRAMDRFDSFPRMP